MCLQPFFVNYDYDKKSSKYVLDFKRGGFLRSPSDKAFKFRCRNCPECWLQDTTEWAIRCALEAKQHTQNCVLTLTYADEGDGELHKRDYQLFMKRLRKRLKGLKIKYFVSGEYGSLRGRPHFHIPIFGWCPDDLVFYKKSKTGINLYNSQFIQDCWSDMFYEEDEFGKLHEVRIPIGYVTVDANPDYKSYFYSAKYMQKIVSKFGQNHIQDPFICMSKGIAQADADAFDPYKQDFIYISGHRHHIPRYFYRRFAKLYGKDSLECFRAFQSRSFPKYDLLNYPLYLPLSPKLRVMIAEKKISLQNKFNLFYKKLGLKTCIRC